VDDDDEDKVASDTEDGKQETVASSTPILSPPLSGRITRSFVKQLSGVPPTRPEERHNLP